MGVHELFKELEAYSEKSDKTSKEQRKALWNSLLPFFGSESTSELIGDLAHDLGVQPITIRRWISGDYAPRPNLMKQLRARLGAGVSQLEVADSKTDGPNEPVPFAGAHAALRTIDHFFYCLAYAKSCFVFKGLLGFHAGRSDQTRRQLVNVLQGNVDLRIYYVFPRQTPAAETFGRFRKSDELTDPAIGKRIRDILIAAVDERLGLERSFASPFVVIYNSNARKTFRRPLDIWYEVPVEPIDAKNEVVDREQGRLFVFVQLPLEDSKDLWEKLTDCLKGLEGIEEADLEYASIS